MTAFSAFKGFQMASERGRDQKTLITSNSGNIDGNVTSKTEVQSMTATGTRSNIISTITEEHVTVAINNTFNAGVTQDALDIQLDDLGSGTIGIGSYGSWTTGTPSNTLPTGVTYIAGDGVDVTGSTTNIDSVVGRIVNNTGAPLDLTGATFSFEIDVSSITTGDTFLLIAGLTPSGSSSVTSSTGIRVLTTIELGVSTRTTTFTGPHSFIVPDGDFFGISIRDNANDQVVEYTINQARINIPSLDSASYILDIDTSDANLSGNVSGSFTDQSTATQAAGQIGTDSVAMFTGATVGSVFDLEIPDTEAGSTSSNERTTTGTVFLGKWDLRDGETGTSTSVTFSSWDDWVGNYFFDGQASSRDDLTDPFDALVLSLVGTPTNCTITITETADTGNSATFNVTGVTVKLNSGRTFTNKFQLGTIVSQTGTPPSALTGSPAGWTLSVTGDVLHKAVTIDTNIAVNFDQTLTLTANSGTNVTGSVTGAQVLNPPEVSSTYTLKDYANMELTSFTSSVATAGASDLATVISTIKTAIDNNTETPTDFTAGVVGNKVTITASTGGAVTGLWSINVNHGDGSGNIGFDPIVVETEGVDAATNMLTAMIDGGGLTTPYTTTAVIITADTIRTGLEAHIDLDAAVTRTTPVAGQVLMAAVAQQLYPEAALTITGEVESNTLNTTVVTQELGDAI